MPDGIPYGMRKNGTVTTLKGKNQTLFNYYYSAQSIKYDRTLCYTPIYQQTRLRINVFFKTILHVNVITYVTQLSIPKQYYISMLLHVLHSYLFPNNVTYQCYSYPKQLHINVLTYVTQLSAF